MIIPEKLSKYVTSISDYRASWQDMELGFVEIRKLLTLSESQLADIEQHGLFKDDKKRTCRYITNRPTPLTVDEVISLVTGNFTNHKNKRHNSKTDYKINWEVVDKRRLLEDFSVMETSPVPLDKIEQLPCFHKHFPIHLIQRLSEMPDIQYNNIFERKLIWNPYLNTERFGNDFIKNKEFVHNPNKINTHKSCFYNIKTKRTLRYKESALGYDFWNHIFWLARLSPEKWNKIERYNLLMFSTYDMVCYMNLDEDVLKQVVRNAMFRHVMYAYSQNIWNVTLKLNTLDDLAIRKYGQLYNKISHYKKAPELQQRATQISLGWGNNSDTFVNKELAANLMPLPECFKTIAEFGIKWTEDMPELSLTKQYWQVSRRYHPDLVDPKYQKEYEAKFRRLAEAVKGIREGLIPTLRERCKH